jgi:hypothetical protein
MDTKGERIAALLEEIRALSPEASARTDALMGEVLALYGDALGRVVEVVKDGPPELQQRLLADELVASLLLLHGLHPEDAATRIRAALEKVEAGGAVLMGLDDDGVARVRLRGSRAGKEAIELAIQEVAPETTGVKFEGGREEAQPHGGLVQLNLRPKPPPAPPPVRAPFPLLQKIADAGQSRPANSCELCATPLADDHAHVVDVESRRLLCTCRPCRLLFTQEGAAMGQYRAVPDRGFESPSFPLSEAQWQRLQIPVRMAFFFFNSALAQHVAFYPGPAGATESLLGLDAFRELLAEVPALGKLLPDVEAVLVHGRRGEDGVRCYLVPINLCYELVGRVRKKWRGFDGGEEATQEIESFFGALQPQEQRA